MYRLFYDYHAIGDILMIVFNNQKRTDRAEKRNEIALIYSGDELIGINIFNISQIVRIKAKGMIVNPAQEFLQVINHILKNAEVDPLPEQTNSGFIVGQVLEIINNDEKDFRIAKVDIGSRVIYTKIAHLEVIENALVVIALADTILFNGQTVNVETIDGMYFEGKIATFKDLNIDASNEEDKVFIIEEFMEIGQDFFAKE
ncbi:MAG: DUF4479 domain-containing protein [Bacilli bacterium]|jgi:hypothetical protein|nr:DUF4479 domain-containing protein [Bacilli bacterium]